MEVIEIHNNGDMDVTMSRELMRSKFELYSIVESDYSLFHFSFTYKKETIYDRNRKAYNEKVLELIRSENTLRFHRWRSGWGTPTAIPGTVSNS